MEQHDKKEGQVCLTSCKRRKLNNILFVGCISNWYVSPSGLCVHYGPPPFFQEDSPTDIEQHSLVDWL